MYSITSLGNEKVFDSALYGIKAANLSNMAEAIPLLNELKVINEDLNISKEIQSALESIDVNNKINENLREKLEEKLS